MEARGRADTWTLTTTKMQRQQEQQLTTMRKSSKHSDAPTLDESLYEAMDSSSLMQCIRAITTKISNIPDEPSKPTTEYVQHLVHRGLNHKTNPKQFRIYLKDDAVPYPTYKSAAVKLLKRWKAVERGSAASPSASDVGHVKKCQEVVKDIAHSDEQHRGSIHTPCYPVTQTAQATQTITDTTTTTQDDGAETVGVVAKPPVDVQRIARKMQAHARAVCDKHKKDTLTAAEADRGMEWMSDALAKISKEMLILTCRWNDEMLRKKFDSISDSIVDRVVAAMSQQLLEMQRAAVEEKMTLLGKRKAMDCANDSHAHDSDDEDVS